MVMVVPINWDWLESQNGSVRGVETDIMASFERLVERSGLGNKPKTKIVVVSLLMAYPGPLL